MKLYDFLQFGVCVFSVLAAGFWLQSATTRLPKLATKARWRGAGTFPQALTNQSRWNAAGTVCASVRRHGGFFPIGCSGAAICRPKLIPAQQEMTDMPPSLEGKIAVVTGVSHQGQIGETVAKVLADRGAALVICARTQRGVEVRAAIAPMGPAEPRGQKVKRAASTVIKKRMTQVVNAAQKLLRHLDVTITARLGCPRRLC